MIVPLQRVVTIKSDHALNNCDCHLYPNPNIDVVVSEGCILKKDYEPPLQQFHFQLRWKPQIRGYKYINMYIYRYRSLSSYNKYVYIYTTHICQNVNNFSQFPIYISNPKRHWVVLSMSISCNAVGNLDDSWQDDIFIIHTG